MSSMQSATVHVTTTHSFGCASEVSSRSAFNWNLWTPSFANSIWRFVRFTMFNRTSPEFPCEWTHAFFLHRTKNDGPAVGFFHVYWITNKWIVMIMNELTRLNLLISYFFLSFVPFHRRILPNVLPCERNTFQYKCGVDWHRRRCRLNVSHLYCAGKHYYFFFYFRADGIFPLIPYILLDTLWEASVSPHTRD